MSEPKLLSCPFCGAIPKERDSEHYGHYAAITHGRNCLFKVMEMYCSMISGLKERRAWNRRIK